MEIKILNERENPLLNRKEIRFNLLYDGAIPSIKEVRSKLLSILNSNEKLTVVDYIKPGFGSSVAKCYVKIYSDENSIKVEPAHKLSKNFEEKKPKGEEKPPEKKTEIKEEK